MALNVDSITGDEMIGGQRDEPGVFIDLPNDVDGADFSQVADVHQPDLHAFVGQSHPRINVGRIIIEIDEDVVALSPWQAAGDKAQAERGRPDERDFLRFRFEQAPGGFPKFLDARRGDDFLLVAKGALRGVIANRFGDAAGQGADSGVAEKDFFFRDREFVWRNSSFERISETVMDERAG